MIQLTTLGRLTLSDGLRTLLPGRRKVLALLARHEAARRKLSLADAFTYEALFGVPASALFPGEYDNARAGVEARAIGLLGKLARSGEDTLATRQKRLFLEGLVRRVRK